jgi:non-specific serine/threonine protein kinase
LLGSGSDVVLSEMRDEELLKLVALDLNAATREAGGG